MRSTTGSLLLLIMLGLGVATAAAKPTKQSTGETGRKTSPSAAKSKAPREETRAGSLPTRQQFDLGQLEDLVFACVNAERARHGLPMFRPDASLQRAARLHSGDMATRNYFSHDSKRGFMRSVDFGDRLRGSGVSAPRLAENIAMLPLVRSRRVSYQVDGNGRRTTQMEEDRLDLGELARWATQQWMESPGHRKNILSPALSTMGIGAAVGKQKGEDYVYLTQDFGGR